MAEGIEVVFGLMTLGVPDSPTARGEGSGRLRGRILPTRLI